MASPALTLREAGGHRYEFGPFHLDPRERRLLRDGQPVALTPKTFDVLLVLVSRAGHLVEKDELIQAVWPDTVVEEGNLSVTISMLRKALGAGGDEQKYVETVAKRGYRFVSEVRVVPYGGPEKERAPVPAAAGSPVALAPGAPRARPAWLAAGLLMAVALLVLLWMPRREPPAVPGAAAPPPVRSLAVLPFKTLGGGSGDEYLGIGMADTLITKLGNTGQIVVRPTSAVLKYADSAVDAQAAGREQGVDAVLDGHIYREGERLRVTVQLVRVGDGVQLWADTFEGKLTSIFAVQDTISEKAALSIRLKLTGEDRKLLAKRFTENRDAYQAYVKGRYFWNRRTEEALKKGMEYFQQAIALDPTYAQAYAGQADSYALLSIYAVVSPREAYPKAREAAQRALALDEELAEAHSSLGVTSFYYDWDGAAAERHFKRALEINPNYAIARMWYALNLAAMGRLTEAGAEMKRAQETDPLSLIISTNVGWILYLEGRYDQAIEAYEKTIEMDPRFARAHFRLGLAYEQKGQYEEALAAYKSAVSLSRGDAHYESFVGHAYAVSGRKAEARKVLQELKERAQRRYVPAFGIAWIHLGLGEKDAALPWLEKAVDERAYGLVFMKVEPGLSALRADPRMADLVGRTGL